jgi:hypothetical protein
VARRLVELVVWIFGYAVFAAVEAAVIADWQAEASADLDADDEWFAEVMAFVDGASSEQLVAIERDMEAELRAEVVRRLVRSNGTGCFVQPRRLPTVRVRRIGPRGRTSRRVSRRTSATRAGSAGSARPSDDPEPVAAAGGAR